MTEIATGTLVDGRYKIVSRLGSGGMADVYLAEDQQLGRNVALKLLHRRFSEDPGFVERFRREAQAAAGLQHPNVVSVYDRGSYDDTYYIAMEYLSGRTLKQVIRQEAPLEPVRAIEITIQILKAARFAHRRGVIHRDLKPHNVMLDDADHAKVTDFGIARAGASDMTETGSIMGTAQYLSPEQAQGHPVSASSDLYSIGVVLYELLTGRVPFDAEAAVTIALKHVSEAPAPPSSLNPQVPPELEQIVMWSLNKDPADRPADADQLIVALEHAREAILSGDRGQRTAQMAALGLAAAAAGGPPPAPVYPEPPPPPTADVDSGGDGAAPTSPDADHGGYDQPRRARRWPWVLLLAVLIAAGAVAAFLLTRPAQAVVPTVVNLPITTAQTDIQNAGFTPNLIYRTDPHQSGIVIGQSPLAGTKVDKGSIVTLTVSSGPGTVAVPNVEGFPKRQAIQMIRQAHLTPAQTLTEFSGTIVAGSAIRTDPGAGTQEPPGTAITLFVSSGPAPVIVPNVVGQKRDTATSTLEARGFNVTTTTQATTSQPAGTVTSQSPTGGSKQPPGSTVSLVIATAPPTVAVPAVVGSTFATASSTLKAAGFKVAESFKDTTDMTQNGIVLSQTPAANTQVSKGTTVTVVVGRLKTTTTPTTPTTPTTTT